jgi:hypothetical protein
MANVAHSSLTGSDLHEPKGVAAAAANKVYVTNGSGSGVFTSVATFSGAFGNALYHVRDERSSGTAPDNLTSSAWNTRAIQTEKTDELTVALASNQIPLAAGTYWCEGIASVYFNVHGGTNNFIGLQAQSRLRNVTDGSTLLLGIGSMHQTQHQGSSAQGNLEATLITTVTGRFTLAGTKTIEFQTIPIPINGTPSIIQGGRAQGTGENEVYLDLMIWKLS